MGATVAWCQQEGIIVVEEHDEVTEQDFVDSVDAIRRLSQQYACMGVLVDTTRQTTPTDVSNLYERATHAAARLQILGLSLAIVVNEQLRKPHEFFENVAVNRGVTVQVFYDRETAIAWLQSRAN